MTPTEKAIRDFCGHHADWWPSTTQVQEMLALTQLEQEPVAWIEKDIQCDDFDPDSVTCEKPDRAADGWEWIPLYTAPPQRTEQEPVAMRMPKIGDRVVCIEDESLATVQSLTAGGSPDIKFDDGSHGTYLLREFAELFRYASTPQRTWVDLTDEEIDEWTPEIHTVIRAIEAKLKEKNT